MGVSFLSRTIANLLNNLRLRTKLLLSLVLTTAVLTFAMLLAVRYSVQKHAQQEVVSAARSSLLTFDALLGEHQKALARKADLLATRASMSGDDIDVTPSSGDALESD